MTLRPLKLALIVLLACAGPAAAAERQALLMEGKKTLFQRILTRPDAQLRKGIGGDVDRIFPPFQPFYVFARKEGWIEVGNGPKGPTAGWLETKETMAWKQNIVVSFANPAGRERQLLFDSQESLFDLLNHEASLAMAKQFREAAESGASTEGSGVLSIEPAEYVDIRAELYLLPILDWVEDFHPMSGDPMQMLNVASVPFRDQALARTSVDRDDALRDYRVGVVFVIDTTQSMQPYIDETRRAVREIFGAVAASEVGERVNFGMIGFRDNVAAKPELGYVTRPFVPLAPDQEPASVLAGLDKVTAASVSSVGFNEDSIAGLEDAIDTVDWDPEGKPYGGRYIILITDAGPKRPGDPNARSGLDPHALRLRANAAGVAVLTLHLRTPAGAPNHDYAEGAYRELSRFGEGEGEYYYGVEKGDPQKFGEEVRRLSKRLIGHITSSLDARLVDLEEEASAVDPIDRLGLAMQLAFLGRVMGTQAPDVFETWIADQALEDPRKRAVEVRLLITKNQLSTMRQVLSAILETGESTQSGLIADQFFGQLKGAIAGLAQNPDNLLTTDFETLGGAFGEFLADLPYHSRIMETTEDRWMTSGIDRRLIMDSLRAKLTLYERFHDNPDNWKFLFDGAPPGETVFPMPFSALP